MNLWGYCYLNHHITPGDTLFFFLVMLFISSDLLWTPHSIILFQKTTSITDVQHKEGLLFSCKSKYPTHLTNCGCPPFQWKQMFHTCLRTLAHPPPASWGFLLLLKNWSGLRNAVTCEHWFFWNNSSRANTRPKDHFAPLGVTELTLSLSTINGFYNPWIIKHSDPQSTEIQK